MASVKARGGSGMTIASGAERPAGRPGTGLEAGPARRPAAGAVSGLAAGAVSGSVAGDSLASPDPGVAYERAPDAVVEVDRAGVVRRLNKRMTRLSGYEADELVGRALVEVLRLRAGDGAALTGSHWRPADRLRSVRLLPEQVAVMRCRDGSERRVRITGRFVRSESAEVTGLILALRAERASHFGPRRPVEVISVVGHELRSPLTSVKGFTSLLLHRWDELRDEQKKTMLEQVNHDADRVTRLIGELLDITRLETGQLRLQPRSLDLSEIAQRVISSVGSAYPELEATSRIPSPFPGSDYALYADADKVHQVLINLVENACKHASPKGVTISAELRTGDDDDQLQAIVAVADHGPGIPAADLPGLFSMFSHRDGQPSGLGLGLWISRGLVEAHGGSLDVQSVPGKGSTFRFGLPLSVRRHSS